MINFCIDGKDLETQKRFQENRKNCLERPKDAKTREVVKILQSMQVRPALYFGKTRSYTALRAFLFGYSVGTRVDDDYVCYWSDDLGIEVDEELRKMTEGKEYSDEEMFDKFFEAFDFVINRDYPQYMHMMHRL